MLCQKMLPETFPKKSKESKVSKRTKKFGRQFPRPALKLQCISSPLISYSMYGVLSVTS